jgi:hypothetical protein
MYASFYSSTNITVTPTQNGILLEESGSESDGAGESEHENDLLDAELLKIHALETESFQDKIEDVTDGE